MAASDEPRILDLQPRDIEAGLALSAEAGWNQTGDDWRHFIQNGRTIGLFDEQGILIASAAALPYGGPFGFIGMVLVTRESRRRGFATRLVDCCISELLGRGLTPVLDATDAGAEVYRKQGFVPQFGLGRWEGVVRPAPKDDGEESSRELARIAPLDAHAFGASRVDLLADFLSRRGTRAEFSEDGHGFSMVRSGRRALQTGPVVAPSESVAVDLLDRVLARASGAVFIDVPSAWQGIANWLSDRGFVFQRGFTRMALGRAEPFGNPQKLFAVAGPEFG